MARFKRTTSDYIKWRYHLVLILVVLAGAGLLLRLGYIQIVQHKHYVARAEVQYGSIREIPATRGTIKSSDGFELAGTQPAYLMYAEPKRITNPQQVAAKLVDILNQPSPDQLIVSPSPSPDKIASKKSYTYEAVVSALNQKKKDWVLLAQKLDQWQVDRIKEQNIQGVDFQSQQKRYYPEGSLASHVLGFVGQNDQGADQGYYGIEGYFDRDLRGKSGKTAYDKDPSGNPIPVGDYASSPAEDGSTITLTINRGLQYLIEQKLKKGIEDKGAESGSAIVMEPASGKIVAMANYPTFSPADISSVSDAKVFKNSAISDAYEPGSVVKSFTVATGIEQGSLTPETTYTSAPYKVGDHTITTVNKKYYGTATTTKMLEMSDNTGAAQFALKIGKTKFIESLHAIGLDRPTGITLQGESQGSIPDPKDWLPVTLATASFGQGISVTPLQLLEMMATIANQGLQMKPTIIESVTKGDQTTVVQPESVKQVFSQKTAQTVSGMLEQVVMNGEFRRLALQGYKIAGKTSTAQIPIPGGYDPNHTITTFVGFAPVDDPKFIMLIKLDKPSINNSAETVVPVWMDISQDLFKHYGISSQDQPN